MAGFTLKQIADQMYPTCPDLRWITLDADGVKGWSGTTRTRWTSGFWAGRMAFSIERTGRASSHNRARSRVEAGYLGG